MSTYTLSVDQADALTKIGAWYKGKSSPYLTLDCRSPDSRPRDAFGSARGPDRKSPAAASLRCSCPTESGRCTPVLPCQLPAAQSPPRCVWLARSPHSRYGFALPLEP